MKYSNEIKITLIIICTFVLVSCALVQTSDVSNRNYLEQNPTKSLEVLIVPNLCELFRSPYVYHEKVIRLKTTLSRIASVTTFGDERCVLPHALIDVEFSPELESSVCNSKNDIKEKLCLIAKATRQNETDANFAVIADIVGYFEYYHSEEGFTSGGLRFRFAIQEIKNIKKIIPVKAEKLN